MNDSMSGGSSSSSGGAYTEYMSHPEKEAALSYLVSVEDWLLDNEDDLSKDTLTEKLQEMREHFAKFESRASDATGREANIRILEKAIEKNGGSKDEKVKEKVKEVEAWLLGKVEEQAKLGKCDDAVLTVKDLKEKLAEIEKPPGP